MGFSWIFIYFHYFHDFLLMDLQATGFHRLRGLHLLLGPHERAGLHRRHGDLPGPRGGPPSAAHAAPGALRAPHEGAEALQAEVLCLGRLGPEMAGGFGPISGREWMKSIEKRWKTVEDGCVFMPRAAVRVSQMGAPLWRR